MKPYPHQLNPSQPNNNVEDLDIASDISLFQPTTQSTAFGVNIPDSNLRKLICEATGYTSPVCNVSYFDMYILSDTFDASSANIECLEGIQWLKSVSAIDISDNPIDDISQLQYMPGLPSIIMQNSIPESFSIDVSDLTDFFLGSRLLNMSINGNIHIYDISPLYGNIMMQSLTIANPQLHSFIPLCHSEDDNDYWEYMSTVFPFHDCDYSNVIESYIPNICPLNEYPARSPFFCDGIYCPSAILNEVYNVFTAEKQCSFIAKEGENGECFTVHDDTIRAYLIDSCGAVPESNGVISIATMRSGLTCSSLDLSDIVDDLTSITTLQGLEYAQSPLINSTSGSSSQNTDYTDYKSSMPLSLTSLTLDGYDLSGDINESYEMDLLVIRKLSRSIYYSTFDKTIDCGLTSLSLNKCGVTRLSDIFDSNIEGKDMDNYTQPFKIQHLDLSNNFISDVSLLISDKLFPADTLETLDISNNYICDIDGVIDALNDYFTNDAFTVIADSQQPCMCEGDVSFTEHKVCRKLEEGKWAIECIDGYFLNKNDYSCSKICEKGYELDGSLNCVEALTSVDDAVRNGVCGALVNQMTTLNPGESTIDCDCEYAWYGDSCTTPYSLFFPDEMFRKYACSAINQTQLLHTCDATEFGMGTVIDFGIIAKSDVHVLYGLQYCKAIYQFFLGNVPIDDISYIAGISGIGSFFAYSNVSYGDDYQIDVSTINSLVFSSRIIDSIVYGNAHLFDISVLYRNICLNSLILSDDDGISIPLCHSEDSDTFLQFMSSVLPVLDLSDDTDSIYSSPLSKISLKANNILQTSCPLNSSSSNKDNGNNDKNKSNEDDATYNCDPSVVSECPSVILNEVYNNVDERKQCSFIAKEGENGECFTVHDDTIRAYLIDSCGAVPESNGIISIATMRSGLTCSSLDLSDIVDDLTSITTLQGLEYAMGIASDGVTNVGISELSLDGYALYGSDYRVQYDQFVLKTLAQHFDYGYLSSGLTTLSVSNCLVHSIEDIIQFYPPILTSTTGSIKVSPYRFQHLDLSNNFISDVSLLISDKLFPADTLETLDISNNYICDIDGVIDALNDYFTNDAFTVIADSQQPCMCEGDVSFAEHKTCRELSPFSGIYDIVCFEGYYLDIENNLCVHVTDDNEYIESVVCTQLGVIPVLEESSYTVQCGCPIGRYGDDCTYLCPLFDGVLCNGHGDCDSDSRECVCEEGVFYGDQCEYVSIPNDNLHNVICDTLSYASGCDLTISDLESITSLVISNPVDSLVGLSFASNLETLEITGDGSISLSSDSIDLIPLSIKYLSLINERIQPNTDFSRFITLYSLDLSKNDMYSLSVPNLFPNTLIDLNVSSCCLLAFPDFFDNLCGPDGKGLFFLKSLNVSDTTISSFTGVIPSVVTLIADDCKYLTDISSADLDSISHVIYLSLNNMGMTFTSSNDVISMMPFTNLSHLKSLSISNNVFSDPTPLYVFSNTLETLDMSGNFICGMDSYGLIEFSSHFSAENPSFVFDNNSCKCEQLSLAGSTSFNQTSPYSFKSLVCIESWPNTFVISCSSVSYHNVMNPFGEVSDDSCVIFDPIVNKNMFELCYDGLLNNMTCIGAESTLVSNVDADYLGLSCLYGWYGSDCSSKCPEDVNGQRCHGEYCNGCDALSHVCTCTSSGHTGFLCSITTGATLIDQGMNQNLVQAICSQLYDTDTCKKTSVYYGITVEQLTSVTYLSIPNNVKTLDGLENASSLEVLIFEAGNEYIFDLSPIAYLSSLYSLTFDSLTKMDYNLITTLTNEISSLKNYVESMDDFDSTKTICVGLCNLRSIEVSNTPGIVQNTEEVDGSSIKYYSFYAFSLFVSTFDNLAICCGVCSNYSSIYPLSVTLTDIVLSGNNIRDPSFIGQVLSLSGVYSIDLSGNDIGDPGLVEILINSLPNISYIDVSYNKLPCNSSDTIAAVDAGIFLELDTSDTIDEDPCEALSESFGITIVYLNEDLTCGGNDSSYQCDYTDSFLVCALESDGITEECICGAGYYQDSDGSCVLASNDECLGCYGDHGQCEITNTMTSSISGDSYFEDYSDYSFSSSATSSPICSCYDGWFGDSCSAACPISPINGLECSGSDHGSCNVISRECVCEEIYLDDACEILCDPQNVCSGHGVCVLLSEKTLSDKNNVETSCNCSGYWFGDSCSHNKVIIICIEIAAIIIIVILVTCLIRRIKIKKDNDREKDSLEELLRMEKSSLIKPADVESFYSTYSRSSNKSTSAGFDIGQEKPDISSSTSILQTNVTTSDDLSLLHATIPPQPVADIAGKSSTNDGSEETRSSAHI
ncbi:hypothetical protein ADUPG1_008267 [Aduncisulcus paluster]|uniref:SRCR domain-containing protein n=1 Tax=Aduncisulcus paluster TaxID=2918883 RepID=A0ABQ5KUA0_9EUKA|nr:hypothetical protein ADUPG1_008267 [Aduncisulcus paluster]